MVERFTLAQVWLFTLPDEKLSWQDSSFFAEAVANTLRFSRKASRIEKDRCNVCHQVRR
jgi:hypothetical protein